MAHKKHYSSFWVTHAIYTDRKNEQNKRAGN